MPESTTVTKEELMEMSGMLSDFADSIPFDQDRLYEILRYARNNEGPWGQAFRINLANRHMPTQEMAHVLCRLVARTGLYINDLLHLRETDRILRSQLTDAANRAQILEEELERTRESLRAVMENREPPPAETVSIDDHAVMESLLPFLPPDYMAYRE